MIKNSYKKSFMQIASSFDAITGESGLVTKLASEIVEGNRDDAVIELYKKAMDIIESENSIPNVIQVAVALRESLISYLGFIQLREICSTEQYRLDNAVEHTLPELMDELNSLIGLNKVKQEVQDLVAYQRVQKLRSESGLSWSKNTLHMAFMGNPGTGKTTVARIVGRIYKQLGLLSKGDFFEVSRTDLIAGYQGQTALKVKKVIEKAKGSVLFIDEAYSITENDHSDSYGRECLTELTKALEDYRDDLVVIVAGYKEPMKKFFESNPGLKSRFNTFIEFDDYSAAELEEILISMCKLNDYELSDAAKEQIEKYFANKVDTKEDNFANGRLVRNLFDDLVMNHAKRVVNIVEPSKDDLKTVLSEDFFSITSEK